jgi:NAD(P)H-nitrite reductase large subunit
MASSKKYDYLIIGNSAAGVCAAESIRSKCADASIAIVGKEPYAAYGRPLISYMIEGKTSQEKMWYKPEGFYEDNKIDTFLGEQFEAVELNGQAKCVKLKNETELLYDKCLVATGSIPFVPGIPGLREGKNVHSFMTLDDANGVWGAVVEATEKAHAQGCPSRVIVIGAGLIGLKAAESLSYHCDEVLVLELAPRILPAVLDAQGAQILQDELERHSITCKPGISAEELQLDDDGNVVSAKLTDGSIVECDVVVAAVGVRPNTSLAVSAGAEENRGLVVNNTFETSVKDIYAAGDVVQVIDGIDGSAHPLALWPTAVAHGRMAGLYMCGHKECARKTPVFAINAVDFFDMSLLTAGLINPKDEDGLEIKVITNNEQYAKFVIRDNKLVGYILLNRPNNAGLYTSMIDSEMDISELGSGVFENAPQNLDFSDSVRWNRLHRGFPKSMLSRAQKGTC